MDYKLEIANAIEENKRDETRYETYFTQRAKTVYKSDSIEYGDYIKGCEKAITAFKENIKDQFELDLRRNNFLQTKYQKLILDGQKHDDNGVSIQEHIERLEKQNDYLKERGYTSNFDYKCRIAKDGQIVQFMLDFQIGEIVPTETKMKKDNEQEKDKLPSVHDAKYELYYSDLEIFDLVFLNIKKELVDSPSSKINDDISEKYKFDLGMIGRFYDFCIETNMFDEKNITEVDFLSAVQHADFKNLLEDAIRHSKKNKLTYLISVISKKISDKSWYKTTANSINVESSKCSGINVPCEWKEKVNAIK